MFLVTIGRNEKAHSVARSALKLSRNKVGVPYNDFKHKIYQYILSILHDDCSGVCCCFAKKIHSVKLVLGDWQSSYKRCRKDDVVLCRARIGHTHLTNFKKDPPPHCEHSQCILTVRHIWVECNYLVQARKNVFGSRDVVEYVLCWAVVKHSFILPNNNNNNNIGNSARIFHE